MQSSNTQSTESSGGSHIALQHVIPKVVPGLFSSGEQLHADTYISTDNIKADLQANSILHIRFVQSVVIHTSLPHCTARYQILGFIL